MGGSSETKTEQPKWYTDAAKKAIAMADQINNIGFVPQVGMQIAGFSPQQIAGMQSAQDWSSAAYGTPKVDVSQSIPKTTTDAATGIQGYSTLPGFMANMQELKDKFPGAYAQISKLAGDPLANPAQTASGVAAQPTNAWNVAGTNNNMGFGNSSDEFLKWLYNGPQTQFHSNSGMPIGNPDKDFTAQLNKYRSQGMM